MLRLYLYFEKLSDCTFTALFPGVSNIFRIVWIFIPACLSKQPNGTLSRMYVHCALCKRI